MDDTKTTIQQLKAAADAVVAERDWHQFHNPKNLSMQVACEAAELMEHLTWVDGTQSFEEVEKYRDEVEQELADVVISALLFANACKIDVSSAVIRKLEITRKKYPIDQAKGRATKYTKFETDTKQKKNSQ
jgi:NTP pyrophosphatase (non-canonical NTP hydrolase)